MSHLNKFESVAAGEFGGVGGGELWAGGTRVVERVGLAGDKEGDK